MSDFDDNETEASTKTDVKPAGGYEVGFGKPPVDHRFKPGQSGNPRGREKALGHMILSLVQSLKQPVQMKKGKAVKNVPKAELALRVLFNNSLRGDWKAFMALMKKGVKLGLIREIKIPNFNSGVVRLPFEYWHEKKDGRNDALREELARRNALLAQGLPYND